MRKKKKNRKSRYWFLILILFLSIIGAVWLYPQLRLIMKKSWSGEEQFSVVLETKERDALILTLTPAKNIAVVFRIPAKTLVYTPWFGEYQVGKIPILVEQEKEKNIYNRSLSYYFGIPIDLPILNSGLDLNKQTEASLRSELSGSFWPPKGITYWRIWRYLSKKEIVWQFIEVEEFSEKNYLVDGTEVLRIDPLIINRQFSEYFSDPVIKKENITLSIFNAGHREGLANKISLIAENMGMRVVEIGDYDEKIDGCLILADEKELITSKSVMRLGRVLGCEIKLKKLSSIGKVKLLIENVKI
jgi:hypothetical protein